MACDLRLPSPHGAAGDEAKKVQSAVVPLRARRPGLDSATLSCESPRRSWCFRRFTANPYLKDRVGLCRLIDSIVVDSSAIESMLVVGFEEPRGLPEREVFLGVWSFSRSGRRSKLRDMSRGTLRTITEGNVASMPYRLRVGFLGTSTVRSECFTSSWRERRGSAQLPLHHVQAWLRACVTR
jgi:hypothetical protein